MDDNTNHLAALILGLLEGIRALQGRATAFVPTPQAEECTGYVHIPYTQSRILG